MFVWTPTLYHELIYEPFLFVALIIIIYQNKKQSFLIDSISKSLNSSNRFVNGAGRSTTFYTLNINIIFI